MRRYTLSLRIDMPLIEAARRYYERNYDCPGQPGRIRSISLDKVIPQWDEAFTINVCGNAGVVVPVAYTKRTPYIKLTQSTLLSIGHHTMLLYKDHTNLFHAEMVTLVPDNPGGINNLQSFTGSITPGDREAYIVRLHRFDQQPELNSQHKAAGIGYRSKLGRHEDEGKTGKDETDKHPAPAASENTFAVTTGDRLISNINDYLKCFDNVPNSDHTYEIKLCVLQPAPGSRTPWAFYSFSNKLAMHNPVFVGHTYLILTAITPNKSTTRNVGFYPKDTVHPLSPVSQGVLNNDEESDYDIALSITTTSSQFFNVLNFIFKGNNKGFNYDLNANNCATFAVDALAQGFIVIPRTIGTWANGKGMNPGDLGEDIRKMKLTSSIKIIKIITASNRHPNTGTCV